MKLNIISLEKIIFSGDVKSLTVPASPGEITILEDHIPLITFLKKGKITVEGGGVFDIEGGVLELDKKELNILVR